MSPLSNDVPLACARSAPALVLFLMIGCWQTFASEKGKDWCVERIIYDDPVTHVSIQELTSADHAADNLYFHVSNFTADNHYLIFVSKRGKSAQLFRAEVDTGRLVQLTDESGIAAHTACPHPTDPQHIIYFRGHELFDFEHC